MGVQKCSGNPRLDQKGVCIEILPLQQFVHYFLFVCVILAALALISLLV
jgi:cell division protein FtsL